MAAWLPGRDADALLEVCEGLGLDPTGRVFDVAGGFVLKFAAPTRRPIPGAVRLRALAEDLLIPADAELVPALLDDESAGLVRDRGLVFLPGGSVLGFDPRSPLGLEALLVARPLPRRDWRPLPEPSRLAERIEEIVVERPDDSPESVLDAGDGGEIGTEPPRPEASDPASTALGKAAMGAGRGMTRLGKALGWGKLADLGAGLVDRALRLAPRLSEEMLGRQAAALNELLRQFREGDVERALRRALPLGEPGEVRGAVPHAGDQLPPGDLSYDLNGLLEESRGGLWLGGHDVMAELSREYRKAAEEALRRGDFRRAASIYGKLLRDFRAAANALMRGGLHHDAAVLLLAKLDDRRGAALAFEAAGEVDRAVQLYRQGHEHEAAGDLLRRVGEEDAAQAEYLAAADRLAGSFDGHLAAGDLLLAKAGRPDLALAHFAAGWSRRPLGNAIPCALRIARIHAERGDAEALRALIDQADATFEASPRPLDAGQFYNEVAELADRRGMEAMREEFRDRALLGIAAQLRRRARPGEKAKAITSKLLGSQGGWPAALVSDASFAVEAATRPTAPDEPRTPADPATRRFRVGSGTVAAVAAAPGSGEVFLGFEGGEVFGLRPDRSMIFHVTSHDLPVLALATDPDGERLVILREGPSRRGVISSHARRPDGTYRLLVGTTFSMEGRADPWLTPVLPRRVESLVGLWDGQSFGILSVGSLIAWYTPPLTDLEVGPTAGLLLNSDRDDEELMLLMQVGPQWCLIDIDGRGEDRRHETGLSWWPTSPEGSPLRSVPVSWASFAPGHIDLAGLGENGSLQGSRLKDGDLFTTCAAAGPREGGYLAAAIVREGLVAGVTRSRIEWLLHGARRFLPWRTTEVSIPSAVACFPCRQTRELVVVCKDGTVVNVPIPG